MIGKGIHRILFANCRLTKDDCGRVTQEQKSINISGNFQISWMYNSADLPVTTIYPGNNSGGAGEMVTYTCHPQKLLNTAIGTEIL